jgi:hypothetical protein
VPRRDLTKHIECDPSLSRLVIYGYETAPQDAELIEQSIKEAFDWIKSVWVDCDTYHHVTVNLDVSPQFHRQHTTEQYRSFFGLILHIVECIRWDPSKTALVYNGTTYRLNLT